MKGMTLLALYLVHYLFPHESNNHRPKLLHVPTLFVLALGIVFYQVGIQLFSLSGFRLLGYAANISVQDVVSMTNSKRAEAGLPPVEFNQTLSDAARAKGEDMLAKDYWAHVAPDGTQPWKFFTDVGYRYRYAGENLARDFSNASSAVDAWMASPTHKDNILSDKYKEIGIAVVEGDLNGVDTTIIVQLFGTKLSDSGTVAAVALAKPEEAATTQPTPKPVIATPQPTAIAKPSPIATLSPTMDNLTLEKSTQTEQKVLISPFVTTRVTAIIVAGILFLVLVVDALIVSRRRISRIAGRSLAHLSYLAMIIAIAIILRAGQIL